MTTKLPAMRVFLPMLVALALCDPFPVYTQSQSPVEFAFVSIKNNTRGPGAGGGIRWGTDGSFFMTNQPIGPTLGMASPVPIQDSQMVGVPDWANSERYDLTAIPPPGMTSEQRVQASRQMWQALFATRMKLEAHIELREQTTLALVVASRDGRLGPALTPSTPDCRSRPPARAQSPTEVRSPCGTTMDSASIITDSTTMDQLARWLGPDMAALVTNRTGLEGPYAFSLTFPPPRLDWTPGVARDNVPAIVTALQKQLGLNLVAETTKETVFVIDHVERPSAD